MLKDITLGQYLPGNSVVHRMDPRTKILLTLAYIVGLFLINNLVGYLLLGILMVLVLRAAKIPLKFVLKGIKPLYIFILFTAVINIFMTKGTLIIPGSDNWFLKPTYEGVYLTVIMAARLIYLVAGTSLLTYTTSPVVLADGIESLLRPFRRFGLPTHELAMMMTIAIRFIPTIIEETDKIMKAQSARGADFDTGGLVKKAKAMVPLLIPLFISAFRRADELALAMECRAYQGGDHRTKMKQLRYTKLDLWTAAVALAAMTVCIIIGRLDFSWAVTSMIDLLRSRN